MDELGGAAPRRIVRTVEEAEIDSSGVVAVGAVGSLARAVLRIHVRVRGVEHVTVDGERGAREIELHPEVIAGLLSSQRTRVSWSR